MIKEIKQMAGRHPAVGKPLRWLYSTLTGKEPLVFERSDQYWEDRYRRGGTSGSGSAGRLARFKAEFLNDFVDRHHISSVVEFGCGDGTQLQLANYPRYVGFDVAPTSVALCEDKFGNNPNYEFHLVGSKEYENFSASDISLSIDVIYHLIEDRVFEAYMRKLFSSASLYVIIYAYDFDRFYESKHERGRKFTAWIAENVPEWTLSDKIENRYPFDPRDPENTSQSDFFIYRPSGHA